jgi:hypothetical protein
MIDPLGEPVVMDFGLARRSDSGDDTTDDRPAPAAPDAGLTQHGSVLGTPAYMPPEQARGDVAMIGPRSDVYALGVILFELLTGRRPFVGDDTAETIRQILEAPPPRLRDFYPWMDVGLEAACQKALAKAPEDRFWSMAQFADALKEVVEPELQVVLPPPLPPKPTAPVPPKRERKKRRWLTPLSCLGVAAGFVLVCVGGPTLAIYWLVGAVTDKVKEIQQTAAAASADWQTVRDLWRSPPADAPADVVFPPTLPGGYTRLRQDVPAPDADLGLTLPGRRTVSKTPDGDEVAVSAYVCSDPEAAAVEGKIRTLISRLEQGGGPGPSPNRTKVVYSHHNSTDRTVTFGFANLSNQNQEYGKTWFSQGWLFHFHTTAPMVIESFPPKYLLEVAKKANAPPPKPKAKPKA